MRVREAPHFGFEIDQVLFGSRDFARYDGMTAGNRRTLLTMADEREPTQKTPKGAEIPVPEREAVIRDLMKVAPRVEPPADADEPDDQKP
jgi:hypothetical protein